MTNHIFQKIDGFTDFDEMEDFYKNYLFSGKVLWKFKQEGSGGLGIDSFGTGLTQEELLSIPFLKNTKEKLEKILIHNNNYFDRILINGQATGQDGSLHVDNSEGSLTALLFCNPRWTNWYGGEFLLYDGEGKEIIDASSLIPNRLIIFSSHLPHRGIGPIHVANGIFRTTVAFQFKVKQ